MPFIPDEPIRATSGFIPDEATPGFVPDEPSPIARGREYIRSLRIPEQIEAEQEYSLTAQKELERGMARGGLEALKAQAKYTGKEFLSGLNIALMPWTRAKTATLSGLEEAQVSFPGVPQAIKRGWRLQVNPQTLSKTILNRMGWKDTLEEGKLATANRFTKALVETYYETYGTDPVLFAWNVKSLPAADKVALYNKAVKLAGKKVQEISAGIPGVSPKLAKSVGQDAMKGFIGRQLSVAKKEFRQIPRSSLQNIIRRLKTVERVGGPPVQIPPIERAIAPVRPTPPITPPVVPPVTPPTARPPVAPPIAERAKAIAGKPAEIAKVKAERIALIAESERLKKVVPFDSEKVAEVAFKIQERNELLESVEEIKVVPKELEPLAREARKYKSAEEFEKAFEYHGGPEKLIDGRLKRYQLGGGADYGGIFTTPSEKYAKSFLRTKRVYQAYLGDRKILDLTTSKGINEAKKMIGKSYKTMEGETLTFTKQDFDFMIPSKLGADWATFNEDLILSMGYDGAVINETQLGIKTTVVLKGELPVLPKGMSPKSFYQQATKPPTPTITPKIPTKPPRIEPEKAVEAKPPKDIITIAAEAISPKIKPTPAELKSIQDIVRPLFKGLATTKQTQIAHILAGQQKLTPRQFHTLERIYTGKKTMRIFTPTGRIKKHAMTIEEAKVIIDVVKKVGVKVGVGRPVIPREKRVTTKGFFPGMDFRKPTAMQWVTPQAYYAQRLGVKPLVERLEAGKRTFDLSYRDSANEVFKQGKIIEKLGRTTAKERIQARIKNVPTKAIVRMRNLLDTYEEAPDFLLPQEKEVFNWFRNLNRTMREQENIVRAKLDLEPIKYRKAYVRHIAEGTAREMLMGKYPFPQELSYWSKKVVGKKIFNPMELQRQLEEDLEEIWTRDLIHATKSMLWTGLKEVHLSQPLKFFNEQLGAVAKDPSIYKNLSPEEKTIYDQTHTMPESTRRWVTDYVNQAIKGQETEWDASINRLVSEGGVKALFDKILAPFGRAIGSKPITHLFQTTGRLTIHGVMGPLRPKQLIRNKFQLVQNLALYTIKANLKSFLPATKQIKELMNESLWLKGYTGFEELPTNIQGRLERLNLAPFQWSALTNAQQAMKAAYWDTYDLITNPKWKEFGWADPARTYKEPKEFLYASEKEKAFKEMEFGANVTQYGYTPLDMPQVFRHKTLIPFTRLQSWWMNHFFKFNREGVYRAFKGETGYGTKLPLSRRVGWFRYLLLGGLILNTLGYYRSYLFGAAPQGLPPVGQLMLAMYVYAVNTPADNKWKKRRKAEAERRMANALKTFIPGHLAYKDFRALMSGTKPLSEYFFYKKWKRERTAAEKWRR